MPGTGASIGVERILAMLPGADARPRAPGRRRHRDGLEFAGRAFGLAATARAAGLRASVYLGGSGKLGRQLKWAGDSGARWA